MKKVERESGESAAPPKPRRNRKKEKQPWVWIGEARYQKISQRWILWTTCRLTQQEAKIALTEHPSYGEFTEAKVTKWAREGR